MGALADLRIVLSPLRDSRVAIRAAGPADVTQLAQLRYRFRADFGAAVEPELDFFPRCQQWMKQRLVPASAWRCWVAESGNRLVGTAWLQFIEKLPNPVDENETHAYISSLFVDPSWRNAGLGSALLERCLEECVTRDVDAVILWPTPQSRALYERHGFAVRDDVMERRAVS